MILPRFHLRDLFWLILVVALACGWSQEGARLRQRLQAETALRAGTVNGILRWLRNRKYQADVDASGRIEVYYHSWTEIIDPSTDELRPGPPRRGL